MIQAAQLRPLGAQNRGWRDEEPETLADSLKVWDEFLNFGVMVLPPNGPVDRNTPFSVYYQGKEWIGVKTPFRVQGRNWGFIHMDEDSYPARVLRGAKTPDYRYNICDLVAPIRFDMPKHNRPVLNISQTPWQGASPIPMEHAWKRPNFIASISAAGVRNKSLPDLLYEMNRYWVERRSNAIKGANLVVTRSFPLRDLLYQTIKQTDSACHFLLTAEQLHMRGDSLAAWATIHGVDCLIEGKPLVGVLSMLPITNYKKVGNSLL